MTAVPFRPNPFSHPGASHAEPERRVIFGALALALALHLASLLIPLPERTPPPEPPAGPQPPTIRQIDLPPPEPPPIDPEPEPEPIEHRLPVPFIDDRPIDPVDEERPPLTGPHGLTFVAPPIGDPVPPPPPIVIDEGTEGLTPPVLIQQVDPEYPRHAIQARVQGRVVLSAVINVEGEVVSLEVLSASRPDLGLSDAAIEAVSRWRYAPGTVSGRPVPVRLRVFVEFTLR